MCHCRHERSRPCLQTLGDDDRKPFSFANAHIRLEYDAVRGQYTIYDSHSRVVVKNAHVQINEWASNQPPYRHTAETAAVTDALGKGRKLRVTSTASDRPTLFLEITLYEGKGFIVFNAGLENTPARTP